MKSSGITNKFFMLLLSSIIAALIVIAVKTAFSLDNQQRMAEIQEQIDNLQNDIRESEDSLDELSDSPNLIECVNALKEVIEISRKYPRLYALKIEQSGLDSNFFELFLTNCLANLFIYTFDIFVFLIIFPLVSSLILYYCFAPIVERIKPIMAWGSSSNNLIMTSKKSLLKVKLDSLEHLFLRAGWVGSRCDVEVKTRFMWKWNAPLITFAAQLFELKEYFSERGKCGEITIAAPAADLYIGEILLQKNSAIVIRPKYLIGVSNGIKIQAIWNFSLHNILAGKIRQIVLYGEGRVFIYGYQGVNCITAEGKNYKIESDLLIGYDARSAYSLCRTETWWHYFRKESELFDVKLQDGVFFYQTTSGVYQNPNASWLERWVDFILNGIGSVLGF